MRRRRKTRYQWLYPIGTVGPAGALEDDSAAREVVLDVPNNTGNTVIAVQDWLVDFPSDEVIPLAGAAGGTTTLGQYQKNDYLIKRIVGKAFISVEQAATDNAVAVWIGLGLFIARAEDLDIQGDPIGGGVAGGAGQLGNYSPLRVANNREPWIWRRTWVLSNQLATDVVVDGTKSFPSTNVGYNSMADGPHIDARTARRVKDGERLYWALAARNYPLNSGQGAGGTFNSIRMLIELRVLGAMRRGRNRSAF